MNSPIISITADNMVKVFNEWIERYAAKPSDFSALLNENGLPCENYGEEATAYFKKLGLEMEVL